MDIPDWIWPGPGKPEKKPDALPPLTGALDDRDMDILEAAISDAVRQEEQRASGAQARLVALLGLASILVTGVSVAVTFAGSRVEPDMRDGQLAVVIGIGAYILAQIMIAMWFTVHGLTARAYQVLPLRLYTKLQGQTSLSMRIWFASANRSMTLHNSWVTDRKIDDMNVALCSVRNATAGALVLLVAVTLIVTTRRFGICVDWLRLFT